MVKIRLARGGAKKKPFYSIVATDSRKRRDSGYIERIGYFNPVARGQEVRLQLEEDRLSYWISQGAQISDRVKQLVKEYRDPSIREKQLAMQDAKVADKAKKIAADLKAKADLEAKEAPTEEAPAEEAPTEEAPADEVPAEEVVAEAPADEAPAEEVVAEAPAEEAPAEEVVAEAPADEAPAEEVVAEAPAEEAPAEEKPAEESEAK
jgi:small subunit ribosomal protein S16